MFRPLASLCLVALGCLVLSGCSSVSSQPSRGRSLRDVKRFFVQSNLNDNHAIDHQIVAALKVRSREAEAGPMTMKPDETQAVITFEDHWTWDFGDHLAFLQLTVKDARTDQLYTTVRYSAKVPTKKSTPAIVGDLVERMLAEP